MAELPEDGGAKRPRLAGPEDGGGSVPYLINFDGFDDGDSSDDSSYHPDKGELQEFQRESEAKVTKLIKLVRGNEVSVGEFRQMLSDRIQTAQPIEHDLLITEIRFAMANAIQFKRFSLLETLIEACPSHLLSEVFAFCAYPLLNFAVKIASVDAVKLLLERGAHCSNDFSASVLETVISAIEDAFDYEYFTEASANNFLKIFRLLFEYKADLVKCPRLVNQIPSIAGRSPEIAGLLLEKMPSDCYLPLKSSDGKLLPSPLFNAFESMNSWDPVNMLENVFKFGILAMLKYGAPLSPVDDMLNASLPPAHSLISLEKRCSRSLWKSPFAVVRIVIEARQSSAINLNALKKEISLFSSQNDDFFDRESRESDESSSSESSDGENFEEFQQLLAFLRSQFPRRLQEITRTAILRTLPIGPKRIQAVQSFDIPPPLISYLLFNDLELPPSN